MLNNEFRHTVLYCDVMYLLYSVPRPRRRASDATAFRGVVPLAR
jgi:hypothetical protein